MVGCTKETESDKKEGKGTERYANGDVYEGEFKADKMEGKGTLRFADGHKHEGDWKANTLHNGMIRLNDVVQKVIRNGSYDAAVTRRAKVEARQALAREKKRNETRRRLQTLHEKHSDLVDPVPQCSICFDPLHHGDVAFAFVPCGHRAVCGDCVWSMKDATRCIVCRMDTTACIRIYNA